MAYVVHDPRETKKDTADDRGDVPELAEIATASLVTLPRNQSIGSELDDLKDHNTHVDAQRRRRELSVAALDLDAFAIAAYPQYRDVRAERLTDWLFNSLSQWLTQLEVLDPKKVADVPLWQRGRLSRHKWQIPWNAIFVAALLAMGERIAIWIWDAFDGGESRPGWVAFLERIEPVTVVLGLVVGAHILGRSAIRWPPAEPESQPRPAQCGPGPSRRRNRSVPGPSKRRNRFSERAVARD
jgi:hypothetical protein